MGRQPLKLLKLLLPIVRIVKALFQSDGIVKGIEDQLFLIDSKQLAKQTKYDELLKMKRLLKRNYFDF